MFRPKNLLSDPEHFLKQWFGFGVLVLVQIKHGQIIQALYPCRDVLTQESSDGF